MSGSEDEKASVELARCPFCGWEAEHYREKAIDVEGFAHECTRSFVVCTRCSALVSAATDEDAIALWNLRAEKFCYDGLVEAVRSMRDWQKTYFRTRSPEALQRSKQAEKEVDAMLESIENKDKPKQGVLL